MRKQIDDPGPSGNPDPIPNTVTHPALKLIAAIKKDVGALEKMLRNNKPPRTK